MNIAFVLKRIIDFSISSILIILFSPLFIIIGIIIACNDGFPIFFRQKRPGRNAKIFEVYKFRTMTPQKNNQNLSDFERMTAFGTFLRKTSLDELPQLINILKGDISLVGPRPLLVEYLDLYNNTQKRRHDVLPGITGWAQINGRNAISWEKKFELDVWYVDNWSLLLDLKILILTVKKVIKKSDINTSSDNTMEKFQGSPNE